MKKKEKWHYWQPTETLPGSEGKIQVLEERVRRKLPLWHPEDAVMSERDGFLPAAWGGEYIAAAFVREGCDGKLYPTEGRTVVKRQRSAAEQARRKSEEMKASERERGRRRRVAQSVGRSNPPVDPQSDSGLSAAG